MQQNRVIIQIVWKDWQLGRRANRTKAPSACIALNVLLPRRTCVQHFVTGIIFCMMLDLQTPTNLSQQPINKGRTGFVDRI